MNKNTYIYINRIVAWIFAIVFLLCIGFANTLPFGAKATYTNTNNTMSSLVPINRVEQINVDGIQVNRQKDDLIYFTTKFPFQFDKAKIKISFKNLNSLQLLEMGYQDRIEWHYKMQVIDAPFFHFQNWQFIPGNPNLFQRYSKYNTVEDFFADFPTQTMVGSLNYEINNEEKISIPGYIPSDVETIINVPLRGSHTMFMYLQDEPFRLTVQKQDLNWYEDPDIMEIRVYKGNDVVFTSIIDDDGITDNSKAVGMIQEAIINNPGPGLPENGVYKVVFDANGDTVIKNIRTNLKKIVFVGSVFPISNSVVYPEFIPETATTTLYTNSDIVTVLTYHDATLQDITINNNEIFSLQETLVLNRISIKNNKMISKMAIPQSDVVISNMGYFAFSEDQFFTPYKLNLQPILPTTDLDLLDYVLTPYNKPSIDNTGYFTVEREFDLATAVPINNKLSWMIRAQGLKENNREVIIKDIKITYTKKGWWEKIKWINL